MQKQILLAVGLLLLSAPLPAQNVKLAGIALNMSEPEIKAALAGNVPRYLDQPSAYPGVRYLFAETADESYVFTLIDGRTAAFSVVHLLPPGQLPFLPSGQKPTVAVLRGLIAKQTWAPSEIDKGDAWWFSDAAGLPLSTGPRCRPTSGEVWLPYGPAPASASRSTIGLMTPSITSYPAKCGVSIHLNQTPAVSEDSVVTSVRYQVLDMRAMNAFIAQHTQPQTKGGGK